VNLFETTTVMGHEQVLFCHDRATNLKAIIAIHNTSLGPAMGATRMWPYATEAEALQDVLRLSRGMTYKAACANLPIGGGKAVILADPAQKTDALLRAYGQFVDRLNGRFITGQDVNISPQDVHTMRQATKHVVGVSQASKGPAPITALGVLLGIKAAVEFQHQRSDLAGLKVAVQGLGNVGQQLCQLLHDCGAELFVTDLKPERRDDVARQYGATVVEPDDIYALPVDIFSPCALGGILNSTTIPQLQASIVAGAANNQLGDETLHGQMLRARGILYCPDYVINAGGLINVYNEMMGCTDQKTLAQLSNIYNSLQAIFQAAQQDAITTHEAAKRLADLRIQSAQTLKVPQFDLVKE
jgi:leucine dehydrogenase